jgi:hypothetical protein
MIIFRSSLAGVAELPPLNQRSTAGKSSPGGEDLGEGELNHRGRQSALIVQGLRLCLPRSTWWQKSVFIRVHPLAVPKLGEGRWLKTNFCKTPFQGSPRLFKAIQTYSRVPGKKGLFFSAPVSCASAVHFPRPMTTNQPNPKPKSTPSYPKSTVDLREELLIWGKNGLQTHPLPGGPHSFCPTMTREWKRANQKQTDANQKMNHASLQQAEDFNLLAGQKSFMVSV